MTKLRISLPTDPGIAEAVGQPADVEIVTWDLDSPPPAEHIDIVVPPYWGGNRRLANIGQVSTRLVQWQSIGFNGVAKYLPEGVPFANASTVHETSTAELALALALASQRGLPAFIRQGDRSEWDLRPYPSLADQRVLIVGYGGVGKAIESRLQGFELASLTRVATTNRLDHNLAGGAVEVLGLEHLHEALSQADVVFLAVPLTPDTKHLIDAAALAALPDQSLLINMARGPVVDTDALLAELNQGRIRAALDVTDPEPLPADHPLWQAQNVLITPHAGGDSTAMLPRMARLIHQQIAALKAGEAPVNVVLNGA